MNTYGILIENISLAVLGKPKTILIGLLSFFRQIVLSFIVVYFREIPVFFILGFNVTLMFVAFTKIHYKPYREKMQYWVTVGHEIGMLIINYLLFCFTDFVDPDAAIVIANCTIFILSAEIIIFFGLGIVPEM
jgi:hypothetical protein